MHPDSWRYRGCLIFLVYHILPGDLFAERRFWFAPVFIPV